MAKSTKLSKSDITNIKAAWKKSTEFQKKLDNRVAYITKYICNVFGCNCDYWSLTSASDYSSEYGDVHSLNIKEFNSVNKLIEYDSDFYTDDDFGVNIFDKNTNPSDSISEKAIDLSDGFPKRWIFEDFEAELVMGRRKYRSWMHKKNQAKMTKTEKAKEKALLEKEKELAPIKNKLTKAELEKLKKHFKENT